MAIERRYEGRFRYYALVCDHCGDEAGHFDDFQEAVEEKRRYGFKSFNTDGEWQDLCSDCQNMMEYKKGTATALDDFGGIV